MASTDAKPIISIDPPFYIKLLDASESVSSLVMPTFSWHHDMIEAVGMNSNNTNILRASKYCKVTNGSSIFQRNINMVNYSTLMMFQMYLSP